jgi:hypothetical protein
MKHARLALLLLPALLAAGCQLPSGNSKPVTTGKSDWPGAPSVAAYTYSDKWTDKDVERCIYVLTYPELVRPHTWSPEEVPSDPVLDRANREILRAYNLLSATGTVALTPEEVGGEFIDLCKGDMADMASELGPESIDNMVYVDDSTFTVHLLTPNIASLTIETYWDAGGAHGNHTIQAVNLDLATGERMTLSNIIKNDQLQSVMKRAYVEILKEDEDALFDPAKNEINVFVNDNTTMPTASQVEKFGSVTNFFLAGEGLMLFWNAYEIAPYAAGQPMAFIPWSELEGKLLIERP